MLRSTTSVVLVAALPVTVAGQPSADTLAMLKRAHARYVATGARYGPSVFPGFRPDTIPILVVLPGRGSVLLGWRGAMPNAFKTVNGDAIGWRDESASSAASTFVQLGGRIVAQMVPSSLNLADIVPLAFHEAFHGLQGTMRSSTKRFGAGENAMFVSSYPVFNLELETLFALEGRVLHAALTARTNEQRKSLAQQFIGIRRLRHRLAGSSISDFDQASELNEGLAQYAQVRALELMANDTDPVVRAEAQRQLNAYHEQLLNLTGSERLSLRLRFYQTGPAIAQLIDSLGVADWKKELLAGNWTLQDMLASVSGADAVVESAQKAASSGFDLAATRTAAANGIDKLRAARLRLMDSVLASPGILLVVSADSLPSRNFNPCGFDPQNHLQVTMTLRMQMRWWRPCSGGPTYVEFNTPSVHDESSGMLRAVIGTSRDVKLSENGTARTMSPGVLYRDMLNVRIDAPKAKLDAVRADVLLRNDTLFVTPKGPPKSS